MRESSKAHLRRMKEADAGLFPWREIFTGPGLDIGSGDNPLTEHLPNVKAFDVQDGDCNFLDKYFPADTFQYAHSSNCLEHTHNPSEAIKRWLAVIKPGGHLIFTVPESTLYGDMLWKQGPRFNDDHKATFSVYHKGSPAPAHFHVPTWIPAIEKTMGVKCLLQRLVDANYDYRVMFTRDQTFRYEDFVECFIECVLLKPL